MHAQQSCPAEKRANESSATNHQKSVFEQLEQRETATEITTVQMAVQEKFPPQVISSSWWSKRPPEIYERLFKVGKAISSLPLWRQQYSPKHETQHLVYHSPALLVYPKPEHSSKFQGQLDFDEASLLYWNLNVAVLSFEKKGEHPNTCPFNQGTRQSNKHLRKLFPHVENKHFDACVWIGTGSVWTSYPWQCRQQEGTNQFSAKPWLWAQLIIWVLTLFYVLRFYWKESGSWVLQDTSQSIRPVKCVFFLQKEEQILFILDHKEASQSPPHSLPMC